MIALSIPGEVPRTNNLYINLPRGGRKLTPEGERYKNEARVHLGRAYHRELAIFKKNRPYVVVAIFHFKDLENKTYDPGACGPDAVARYKRQDATNCIKLVEDIVAAVSGVDDSCTLEILLVKRQLPEGASPHTKFCVWDKEAEGSPFDALLRGL